MTQQLQQHEQLEDSCHGFLQEATLPSKPVVVVWGLVKAGKSSLLNMLSGHIADEFFETGAARTTQNNKELETEHYLLMDTPGFGIDQADSQQAYAGLDKADVVLFVHAPPGELDQEEIELLAQVKATYAEETEKRLVLVLSQLDKNSEGAMELIRKCILDQLRQQLEIEPQCFLVSNRRYRKGATQGLQTLIKDSGIPQLLVHLDGLVQAIDGRLNGVRISRRMALRTELLEELERSIKTVQQQISCLKQPYEVKARAVNTMMAKLRQGYSKQTKKIDDIHKKLKKL